MIITLTGADFSASNIGILTAWRVRTDLGEGATYDGPTSVEKGMPLNATVTVDGSYTVGEVNVTMAGVAVSNGYISEGNVITINIAEVTGNVVIEVATAKVDEPGGDETGGDAPGDVEDTNLMDVKSRLDANTEFVSNTASTSQWGSFRGATPSVDGDCVKIDCSTQTNTLAGIRMGVPANVTALEDGTKVKVSFYYKKDSSYTPVGPYKFYCTTSAENLTYSDAWQKFEKTYTFTHNWDRLQLSSATSQQKEAIFYVKDFRIEVVS